MHRLMTFPTYYCTRCHETTRHTVAADLLTCHRCGALKVRRQRTQSQISEHRIGAVINHDHSGF